MSWHSIGTQSQEEGALNDCSGFLTIDDGFGYGYGGLRGDSEYYDGGDGTGQGYGLGHGDGGGYGYGYGDHDGDGTSSL